MWEKLEEVLKKMDYPYYRQGSMVDMKDLPDTFITFWNNSAPYNSFYDEQPHTVVWNWNIYFYTNNPSLIYSLPTEFIKLAKENNFIIQGQASDIPSGIDNYVGRFLTLKYLERLTNE